MKKRAGKAYAGDFLVQQMIKGDREVVIGMIRDHQFGPSVMFGLGGIFTEILEDVVFRIAPVRRRDALEMIRGIRGHKLLQAIRGMPAVDLKALGDAIIALGKIGIDCPDIEQIDVNPMIISGASPIAVDALIVLRP
jgi:acetyl-CoA synthetase (ADP-forming)